jgi:2-polyprenyl-3-methyl-5-hydroxy-6-metoxy-1,4-benzoquinol methylase
MNALLSIPSRTYMKPSDPLRQREAMTSKINRRLACEGKLTLPAVPSLVGDYTRRCAELFAAQGRTLSEAELAQLKNILDGQLKEAFSRSQRSQITVSYQAAVGGLLNYFVAPQHATIEQTYENWVSTRKPPFFGTEPDAKVMAMARQWGVPRGQRVLDIGAGTGRNTLALARWGCTVDAVEMTPKFAEILTTTAEQESLSVQVICKDVFHVRDELRGPYDLILLSEVVSDFRTVAQLRGLFELAAQQLAPGGALLFNAFVSRPHYSADDAAREFAQQVYTCFFTPEELTVASQGLALTLTSDESVHDYEKTHLPATAWPPTGWYSDWVSGLDVFQMSAEDCPIDMRWLVYRKSP